uniref:Uncharacterized protein n=1 Tax=Rhipicephalus microplus TaxID=6941 RepID=A0A6G5AH70_RHIMP
MLWREVHASCEFTCIETFPTFRVGSEKLLGGHSLLYSYVRKFVPGQMCVRVLRVAAERESDLAVTCCSESQTRKRLVGDRCLRLPRNNQYYIHTKFEGTKGSVAGIESLSSLQEKLKKNGKVLILLRCYIFTTTSCCCVVWEDGIVGVLTFLHEVCRMCNI